MKPDSPYEADSPASNSSRLKAFLEGGVTKYVGPAPAAGLTWQDIAVMSPRWSHTNGLSIVHWHEWIGDQAFADAMLDRLVQSHQRFTLRGESPRRKSPPVNGKIDN